MKSTSNDQDNNVADMSSSQADGTSHQDPPRALSNEEYSRYGRQLIMPEIGLQGQLKIKASKVLLIGLGGLGSPAAMYLAGAGVGTLGLVDGDYVDASNLHRQIAHSTESVGTSKVESAARQLRGLNPLVKLETHAKHLTPQDAVGLVEGYDVVLDCTDHPTTRYMISDACILAKKPLVSASALRLDGQLMVLNDPPAPAGDATGGPCYRCIFPKPPPADSVLSCADGGILGPVVGVMGVMQALECLKVITAGLRSDDGDAQPASMLIFSAFNAQQFRTVRLRPRRKDCAACSSHATVTEASLTSGSLDYVAFCGVAHPLQILQHDQRVKAVDFARERPSSVVDVREAVQFELCNLPGSVNIPWSQMTEWKTREDIPKSHLQTLTASPKVRLICRFGNDSQLALQKMANLGLMNNEADVKDVEGGLRAWRIQVDPNWPDY